jgi:hypothetical protein
MRQSPYVPCRTSPKRSTDLSVTQSLPRSLNQPIANTLSATACRKIWVPAPTARTWRTNLLLGPYSICSSAHRICSAAVASVYPHTVGVGLALVARVAISRQGVGYREESRGGFARSDICWRAAGFAQDSAACLDRYWEVDLPLEDVCAGEGCQAKGRDKDRFHVRSRSLSSLEIEGRTWIYTG